MNNTMGRFIDELTDEERGRLVAAERFTGGAWWDYGCGCLASTAFGFTSQLEGMHYSDSIDWDVDSGWVSTPAPWRYTMAIGRFGKYRVIHAIKLRAGAEIPSLSTPAGALT